MAIFDYDNTLIKGDSFLPFLIYASNRFFVYAASIEALTRYALRRAQKKPTESLRTFIKSHLLHRILKGKRPEDLKVAAEKTREWQKPNWPVLKTLHEHHENGDTIIIASGSLDLYMEDLLRDIPHDALICTDIEVKEGRITGVMVNGNCVRRCKAERVKTWLNVFGPFDESFGYGNHPHDVPMLELVKHRIIVS
ncbi:MAG: HAD family hydrolase [Bdellovibrionales bacterium]